MKLCVFGAGGRTGVEVVKYAHSQGFEVVAFVHSDTSRAYFPESVIIQKGDVMDYESVEKALRGSDVVISVLGHVRGTDPLMQTTGITNIVRAMRKNGIKRILSLTGTGARVEGDKPSVIDRFLNVVIKVIDPNRIRDGLHHVRVLEESGLDFTIVRVLKLSNSNKEPKEYVLTDGGPAELQTSRKKVARVLVDLIHETKHTSKQPIISG
jgi:nucleoside-diphosphate-sugar epimerase